MSRVILRRAPQTRSSGFGVVETTSSMDNSIERVTTRPGSVKVAARDAELAAAQAARRG